MIGWRTVVIANSAKLDYQLGSLIVRREDTIRIHIDEIAVLIIETTSVSLTAALLSELTKRKVKVIFCDEKRNPSSELLPYYGSHDTSSKIRRQMAWTDYARTQIWTEIVSEKIRSQADTLLYYGKLEEQLLRQYLSEIQPGDSTNREGHAAKVYFNALFGMQFTRTDENSVNAALNYGYSLILSAFNRAITANGYLTQIGIFHDNMFNQFNLASDMMEPFRTIVDRAVVNNLPEKFGKEEKRMLQGQLSTEVIISGRRETVLNAIKIYCKSVLEAIEQTDASLIRFCSYEL